MDWFEKEEDELIERYNNGEISEKEFNREMRELRLDYQAEAERSAQDAYDREMERWQ